VHLQNIKDSGACLPRAGSSPPSTTSFPSRTTRGLRRDDGRRARGKVILTIWTRPVGQRGEHAGFQFNTVARVVSGAGEALRWPAHCGIWRVATLLLVTDPGLVSIGLVAPVQDALRLPACGHALRRGARGSARVVVEAAAAPGAQAASTV
jgi:hypothetical protein